MRKIANLLSGLFLILVFAVSITFAYFNTTPISIKFGSWALATQPVSVWIVGAFVIGGTLGLLLGLGIFRNLQSRSEIRRLNKQLSEVKQEVNDLRAISLKELQ